jgi:drug/metabolite transporter (DMT)-like permease
MRKIIEAFIIVLLFAVGWMLLGIFIDIQMISKYDYTPISFTFTFLFIGSVIGFLLALRNLRHHQVLPTQKE